MMNCLVPKTDLSPGQTHVLIEADFLSPLYPKNSPPTLLRLDGGRFFYSIVKNTDESNGPSQLLYRWNVSQQPEVSHFLDDTVSSQSTVYFATLFHPIYAVLPHLKNDGTFIKLEDLLFERDLMPIVPLIIPHLTLFCDQSEALSDEENHFVRLNPDLTLKWLKSQFEKLLAIKSSLISADPNERLKGALDFFRDYLNQEWLARLAEEFPINESLSIDYSNFGRTNTTTTEAGMQAVAPGSKKPKVSTKKEEKPHQGKTLLSYFKKISKT